MKSLLERIEDTKQLWNIAADGVPLPPDDILMHWAARYGEVEIEHAMMRLSSKLYKGGLVRTASECGRYVSGVLSNEAKKTRVTLAVTETGLRC